MRRSKVLSILSVCFGVLSLIVCLNGRNVYAVSKKNSSVYVNAELNQKISQYSVEYTDLLNKINNEQNLIYQAANSDKTLGVQVEKSYNMVGTYARDIYKGDGQMSSGLMSMYSKAHFQKNINSVKSIKARESLLSDYSDFINLTGNINSNITFLKNLKIANGEKMTSYQQAVASMRNDITAAQQKLNDAKKLYKEEADSYYKEQQNSSRENLAASSSETGIGTNLKDGDTAPSLPSGPISKVLFFAHSHLGDPYTLDGRNGFNCSSFVVAAYSQIGVTLPGSPIKQYEATQRISEDQLQPGDLIFYYHPISHVAIYYGAINGKKMAIQALNPRAGVTMLPISVNGMEAVAYGRVTR